MKTDVNKAAPAARLALAVSVAAVWAALSGCASNTPAPLLYQLRAEPPVSAPDAAAQRPSLTSVQLMQPVALPEVLDRDAIVVPRGQSGLQALQGHRWAEPLRDAVPRLLRQDLGALLGPGTLWLAPLPAGLVVQRQLRVEVLTLQADTARSLVQLQARWTLSDPSGRVAPVVQVETLSAPVLGADVDALVVAHRLVLWQFAQRVAQALALQR